MNQSKQTCGDCRFYIPLDEKSGYCGNHRISGATIAARSCSQYEPRAAPKGKTAGSAKFH